MSSSAEKDTMEGESPDDANPSASQGEDIEPATRQVEPVSKQEWDRLRAPFSRSAYMVDPDAIGHTEAAFSTGSTGEHTQEKPPQPTGSKQVVAELRLYPKAIRDRLDLVLGPGRYSYRFEFGPSDASERPVLCHLQVGTARRSGIGTGRSYPSAQTLAFTNAALAFGIGASGKAARPVIVERESRYDVPTSILEALERGNQPSLWAPGEAA
jgi:hypothetical protein